MQGQGSHFYNLLGKIIFVSVASKSTFSKKYVPNIIFYLGLKCSFVVKYITYRFKVY